MTIDKIQTYKTTPNSPFVCSQRLYFVCFVVSVAAVANGAAIVVVVVVVVVHVVVF